MEIGVTREQYERAMRVEEDEADDSVPECGVVGDGIGRGECCGEIEIPECGYTDDGIARNGIVDDFRIPDAAGFVDGSPRRK